MLMTYLLTSYSFCFTAPCLERDHALVPSASQSHALSFLHYPPPRYLSRDQRPQDTRSHRALPIRLGSKKGKRKSKLHRIQRLRATEERARCYFHPISRIQLSTRLASLSFSLHPTSSVHLQSRVLSFHTSLSTLIIFLVHKPHRPARTPTTYTVERPNPHHTHPRKTQDTAPLPLSLAGLRAAAPQGPSQYRRFGTRRLYGTNEPARARPPA
ncbi:hypothetical protein IWX90DRAFT_6478 [Phyllosticta citrichinensis]|uniref:Uncharacterized protein n=1 Tax=Phyllosticta citrichinensis TaxID=1130410 RepID=A0ABR1Y6F8_9PEZI